LPDVYVPERRIDGRPVEQITAFLFHAGGHEDPMLLRANARQSFQGHILLGMGFTFDDTDKKGVASPLAERERLIAANPRNAEVIQPYVGGKETNSSPTHDHHRYVINFRDWPLRKRDTAGTWKEAGEELRQKWLRAGVVPLDYPGSVAADWDELLTIVEKNVKPQRQALPPKNSINLAAARNWWRFLAYRQGLQAAIRGLDRVLARSRVGPYAALAFLPGRMVYAESAVVFPFATLAAFSALQSRVHEVWARFFGSTLRDDPRYTPSSCFETFPFPEDWTTRADLEAALKAGRVQDRLDRLSVRASDAILVPAGTVHGILSGIVLVEIQQCSDTTYRIHDWDRVGPDGRPRTLHVERALDAINFAQPRAQLLRGPAHAPVAMPRQVLARCDHFLVERVALAAHERFSHDLVGDTFEIWGVLSGAATVRSSGATPLPLRGVQFALMPATMGPLEVRALTDVVALRARLPR